MTAKEFLEQAYHLEQEIENRKNYVFRLRSLPIQGMFLPDRPHGKPQPNTDTVPETVIQIMETEAQIIELTEELLDARLKILQVLYRIEAAREHSVLMKRYLEYQDWKTIAAETGMSKNWVYKTHRKGLAAVQKILEELP